MKIRRLLGYQCKLWFIAHAVTLLAIGQFSFSQSPAGTRPAGGSQAAGVNKGTGNARGASGPAARLGVSGTNLIKSDYYQGLDLFADGRCLEAFQAFEKAYLGSRATGESRGIDSVPPLIMMGECLYQQGDSGTAMQHFDAALNLSLASQNWLNLLRSPAPLPRPEGRAPKDSLWAPSSLKLPPFWKSIRNWPIAVAPAGSTELTELLPINGANLAAPNSLPQIDALEILRCQSLALRRRFKLLGPLVKVNPLSEAVSKAFATGLPPDFPEEIRLAHETCYWLTTTGHKENGSIIEGLSKVLLTSGGFEHPLTASARLAIAELALSSKKPLQLPTQEALLATLTAARAEQFDHLDEALELWSQCAFHTNKDAAANAKTLNDFLSYAQTRSRLVALRSQVEQLRQASLNGDRDSVRKRGTLVTGLLQPQEVDLPKMEAVLHYANARGAFQDANIEIGIQQLEESLNILRGATPLSTASPHLYQLNLTLRLLSSEAISTQAGQEILYELLHHYRPNAWRTSVLEELVFQTHDKTEATRALVMLTLETKQIPEQLEAWEGWKKERVNKSNVFHGRLAEFRRSIYSPASPSVAGVTDANARRTQQQGARAALQESLPSYNQQAQTLQQSIQKLTATPKWDLKKWSDDDRKQWDGILKSSVHQEVALWNAVTSPLPAWDTTNSYPDLKSMLAAMEPTDTILSFYSLDGELFGYVSHAGGMDSWKIDDSETLETDLRASLKQMLQWRTSANAAPAKSTADLSGLRSKLIPDRVWEELLKSDRWIVCPDGFLWEFPIELLPLSSGSGQGDSPTSSATTSWFEPTEPIIQSHRVCYSPTLHHIPQLFLAKGQSTTTRVITTNLAFWSDTPATQKSYSNKLSSFSKGGNTQGGNVLDTANGSTLPNPLYTKLNSQHLISLSELHWENPFRFPLLPYGESVSTIADWNPLPWGAPRHVWLLGHERDRTPAENIIEPGDEWLRWTSALLGLGTESILVSRWSVGGESTFQLLSSAIDYSEHSTLSEAWQRSVLTIWSEEFPTSGEPIVKKLQIPKEASDRPIPGVHPVLWSGYMLLGDPSFSE